MKFPLQKHFYSFFN